ncbi:LysR family transcriptional regulator [Kribbella antibiotica]|uniref:LysR family transcriptional regulator n=1 Tax=Kribbella antibiotica TaxID=190195 RepID=A0A4R4YN41_9ACTN|nr:LysR family transcriptional regulator [Kribbella antibiotica]TDD45674.1 LysR family transcriptional regulator [Kribbella antibiotica]
MDLELRHLRVLCGIADAGSVSQAATNLGMSQPALTRLLQRLERRVGGELFSRGTAGVVPTSRGQEFVRRARIVLLEFDELSADAPAPSGPRALRMGTSHLAYVDTLAGRLDAVLAGWDVSLRIEASSVVLVQALTHNQLDAAAIGMSADQEIPLPPQLAQRTVAAGLPAAIGLAADHPLAASDEVELADLAEEAWISPPGPEDGSLASLRAAARRAGFTPRIKFECHGGGGRQLIASGRAVQLVEPTTCSADGMVVRRLAGEPIHLSLVLVWRRDRVTRAQSEFLYQATSTAYATHAEAAAQLWWQRRP